MKFERLLPLHHGSTALASRKVLFHNRLYGSTVFALAPLPLPILLSFVPVHPLRSSCPPAVSSLLIVLASAVPFRILDTEFVALHALSATSRLAAPTPNFQETPLMCIVRQRIPWYVLTVAWQKQITALQSKCVVHPQLLTAAHRR